jgi:hypothetical protein
MKSQREVYWVHFPVQEILLSLFESIWNSSWCCVVRHNIHNHFSAEALLHYVNKLEKENK